MNNAYILPIFIFVMIVFLSFVAFPALRRKKEALKILKNIKVGTILKCPNDVVEITKIEKHGVVTWYYCKCNMTGKNVGILHCFDVTFEPSLYRIV